MTTNRAQPAGTGGRGGTVMSSLGPSLSTQDPGGCHHSSTRSGVQLVRSTPPCRRLLGTQAPGDQPTSPRPAARPGAPTPPCRSSHQPLQVLDAFIPSSDERVHQGPGRSPRRLLPTRDQTAHPQEGTVQVRLRPHQRPMDPDSKEDKDSCGAAGRWRGLTVQKGFRSQNFLEPSLCQAPGSATGRYKPA